MGYPIGESSARDCGVESKIAGLRYVFQQQPAIQPAASPLVYGAYLEFLRRQTDRFDTVLLVLGNHEFYGLTFGAGTELARQLEQEPCLQRKLVLLHRRAHRIVPAGSSSVVTVLGCTLWSAIPDEARQAVAGAVSDFSKIDGWDVDQHNAEHDTDVAWLRAQVESCAARDESVLVATHHAPCIALTSSPRHVGSPWTSAFATDLLGSAAAAAAAGNAAARWEKVRIWVFGHTHYSTDFKVGGTRVVSNQRGYVFPGLVLLHAEEGSRKHKFDISRTVRL